jgi:predicted O-linked N-acetylglucosamine transferase (SPINDLY family)
VLCAFNHTYKILPEAFDAWCGVMRDVPGSVLWLKETNGQLHDNVRREAAARGVAGERIVFAKAVSYAEHFSRLALADVFVDTWPYNAHTTAADALWAGVPVVTLYGNGFASRVAASVLNAAGIPELAFGKRCRVHGGDPDAAA